MENIKVGWIGTGIMGGSMCNHIVSKAYEVSVFNRTKAKADFLVDNGAVWKDTPSQVAEGCDVIFTIVSNPNDVEQVILGKDGILESAKSGAVIVEMSTSEPSLAKLIYKKAKEKGVEVLDAPVTGGENGAQNGTLTIMCGGSRKTFDKTLPLLQSFGDTIKYMGSSGAGQSTKMCNQILIASTMIGVVESLLYGYRSGLDMDDIIDVIGSGSAASWAINNLGRRIAKKDFNPGFFIKYFVKDMGIALKEAKEMNIALPGLALAHQFYVAAMAQGFEELGTNGLYKVFERMNSN